MASDDCGSRDVKLTDVQKEQLRYAAERISEHEDKTYDNFGLFLKLSTAIVGGLGYLGLTSFPRIMLWKVQKIAWSLYWLECVVAVVFTLTIWIHYCAVRRQWRLQHTLKIKTTSVPWWHVWRHVHLLFTIVMLSFPIALRCWLMPSFFK